MIRRPPRSTQSRSSAASDVYKRQVVAPAAKPEHVPGALRPGLAWGGLADDRVEGLADEVDLHPGLRRVGLVVLDLVGHGLLAGREVIGQRELLALADPRTALGRGLAGHHAAHLLPAVAGQQRLGIRDAERVRPLAGVGLLDRGNPLVVRLGWDRPGFRVRVTTPCLLYTSDAA